MGNAATLRSLKLAGLAVTPSDQWVLPQTDFARTTSANIDRSLSREMRPRVAIASGPIRKLLNRKDWETIVNTTGWELIAELYDGTVFNMLDCAVEGEPDLDTDGGTIGLEVSGTPQQK